MSEGLHYTGGLVSAKSATEVEVAPLRFYNDGKVYVAEQSQLLNLFQYLPLVTRKCVAVVLWGQETETLVEPRDFLTDLTTGATQPQAVPMQQLNFCNVNLLPGSESDVESTDYYQWSALLRSLSAFEAYHEVYRDALEGRRVTELLILRPDMPRSLAASMNELVSNLLLVTNSHSAETERIAGKLRADLQYARIDEILATGLHAYLTQFLDRVNDLGGGISRDFLVAAGD